MKGVCNACGAGGEVGEDCACGGTFEAPCACGSGKANSKCCGIPLTEGGTEEDGGEE